MPRHRVFPLFLALMLPLAGCLSGCATGAALTGDQKLELIRRLGEYGCGGDIRVDVGGETGQLGGGAHAGFTFNGKCPERPPAAPQP